MLKLVDGEIKRVDEPALTAINMRLRDDYTADCQRGLDRWNKIIDKVGVAFKLELPHVGFHRQIGEFKDVHADAGRRAHRRRDLAARARANGCRRRTTATSSAA